VVKARVTFDSVDTEGLRITYWMDDDGEQDIAKKVSGIFGILFEEVAKTIEMEKIGAVEN